ncbi:MAG: TetR/AcrR family transcriptional regulator [Synergistaceae bacterium]|jgi:AcrR family transcriptional regulator|nr:TetR/AcrR family transcriptional regulator [Synergistaceae bacterium]
MNKTNFRVIKAREAVKNTFVELMEEIGFSKITVTEIVERARINRSTFYAHYFDKFDLLGKTEEEFLSGIKEISQNVPIDIFLHSGNSEELKISLERFAKYIRYNGNILNLLISDRGDPAFITKLRDLIYNEWREKNVSAKLSVPCEYAISALVGMVTGLVVEWVKSGFRETPDEFVEIIAKFVRNMPNSILAKSANNYGAESKNH